MSKNEPDSKTQGILTQPTSTTTTKTLSATQPVTADPDTTLAKLDANNYLNQSNDCLVIDMDEDVENQPSRQSTTVSLGKKSAKTKVLFDLNNDVNKLSCNTKNNSTSGNKNKCNNKKSDSPVDNSVDEKKIDGNTLGNNFRMFSNNLSNRLAIGGKSGTSSSSRSGKSSGFSKRKNSSSSNTASLQGSIAIVSSSTEFTKMSSTPTNINNLNRFDFPFNERIQSIIEIVRARFNSRNNPPSNKQHTNSKKDNIESKSKSKTNKSTNKPSSINPSPLTIDSKTSCLKKDDNLRPDICQLCFIQCSLTKNSIDPDENYMYKLSSCEHSFCTDCLCLYLKYQIIESRVLVSCPQCTEKMHPSDIYCLLSNNKLIKSVDSIDSSLFETTSATETPKSIEVIRQVPVQPKPSREPFLIQKYEEFMLRRVLVTIPDTRWCPAPDCNYAVIASGCANCPQLYCMRPNCGTSFCYHCKQIWHPNITCEDAAIQNMGILFNNINKDIQQLQADQPTATNHKLIRSFLQRSNSQMSLNSSQNNLNAFHAKNKPIIADYSKEEIKRCPKCQALIVKMDDGSCNHITCAVCGCEFCWLCMKEISDLHYLSPSGCTFWGKKPWSRKKKIMWQLGILIGAPVGIALIAGVAVPAILIGLPIWSGRKVYVRYKMIGKYKRNLIVISTVTTTIILAPLVATLAVGIGVPILLAYVYGVVPISLCRSGGCGVTKNNNGGVRLAFDEENNDVFNYLATSNQNLASLTAGAATSIAHNSDKMAKKSKGTKGHLDDLFVPTGLSSVKVPISAIESKHQNHMITRNELISAKNGKKKFYSQTEAECTSQPTPVLVTITMANKSQLTTELDSKGESSHKSGSKLHRSTKTSRRRSSSYGHRVNSSKTNPVTKEDLNKNKNINRSIHLSKDAAENCGTVELIKLDKNKNSVASECLSEAGGGALSIAMRSRSGNNINNIYSDNENNISSSSSSQQLLENLENNSNKILRNFSTSKRNRLMANFRDEDRKKQLDLITNPSIGEFSIGAYTMTSLSVSGSNLFESESKKSRIGTDSLNVNDAYSDQILNQQNSNDKTSASNTAIANCSINTYQLSTEKKSMNPSVIPLTGSLKDGQSVEDGSSIEENSND